jgi:hypothetical protein
MKKVLAALTIAAILAIAPSAMAKGAKVPKLLCLDWGIWYQQLSCKAIGSVYMAGEKVKTYAINGTDSYSRVVTGTAYVMPGTTTLIASYNTTYTNGGFDELNVGNYLLQFDLEAGTGTTGWNYVFENGGITFGDASVTMEDCKEITAAPLSAPANIDSSAGLQ